MAAGALGAAGAAEARDVYWSLGVGLPGVAVGVGNAPAYPPVYAVLVYAAPPVYMAPQPVYGPPRSIGARRVMYRPVGYYGRPPVYHRPPAPYYRGGRHYGPGWR